MAGPKGDIAISVLFNGRRIFECKKLNQIIPKTPNNFKAHFYFTFLKIHVFSYFGFLYSVKNSKQAFERISSRNRSRSCPGFESLRDCFD